VWKRSVAPFAARLQLHLPLECSFQDFLPLALHKVGGGGGGLGPCVDTSGILNCIS